MGLDLGSDPFKRGDTMSADSSKILESIQSVRKVVQSEVELRLPPTAPITFSASLAPLASPASPAAPPVASSYPPVVEGRRNTKLLTAISEEELELAIKLLEQGADPFELGEAGLNAFHMLAMVNREITKENPNPRKRALVMNLLNMIVNQAVERKILAEEINREATDGRTPLAMTIAYPAAAEWTKTLWDAFKEIGAKHGVDVQYRNGEKRLWAQCLYGKVPDDKIKFFMEKFPEQFTFEALSQKSTIFFKNTERSIGGSFGTEETGSSALFAACQMKNFEAIRIIYSVGREKWDKIIAEEEILYRLITKPRRIRDTSYHDVIVYLLREGIVKRDKKFDDLLNTYTDSEDPTYRNCRNEALALKEAIAAAELSLTTGRARLPL